MFERHSEAICELLRERGLVDPVRLENLRSQQRATGKPLADAAVDEGLIDKAALLEGIAAHLECPYVAELPASLPDEVVRLLPGALACAHRVVPLRADASSIDLLAADPLDQQIAGDLTFALGREVRLIVCDPAQVELLIRQHYREDEAGLAGLLREMGAAEPAKPSDRLSPTDLEMMAGETPIVRFVNLILAQAIRDKASDVHFEPFEHEFKIRYRIDGLLYEMTPPPKALAGPIASRIKVLANLNIAERRLPQDGRIKIVLAGHAVDLRVSTLPTQFGESVVLRVLDQAAVQLSLTELGLPDDVRHGMEQVIRRPNGIFIVTGPTGSGKTTTLYSALRAINGPELKLLTVEDPVEYEIEGIMQVPVNPVAGLTFATALRAFLRQDPDVVMVGEIRDLETAQVAIQAALTGHLVMTTLHTNDAPSAVARLLDMGVEPFLLASTVEAVLAQRLLRRICPHCRTSCAPPAAVMQAAGLSANSMGSRQFFRGRGCPQCAHTGYRGRLGIFEWLEMTDSLRDSVTHGVSAQLIRETARRGGMRSLRDDGLRAVFAGETTLDELIKHS